VLLCGWVGVAETSLPRGERRVWVNLINANARVKPRGGASSFVQPRKVVDDAIVHGIQQTKVEAYVGEGDIRALEGGLSTPAEVGL